MVSRSLEVPPPHLVMMKESRCFWKTVLLENQFCLSLLICQCEVKHGVKKPKSSSSSSGDDERKQALLENGAFGKPVLPLIVDLPMRGETWCQEA